MKKQKFYSTLALITLSASILTACSSAKNTIPENTFAQSSKVSSIDKASDVSSSKASNQSSSKKSSSSKASSAVKTEQASSQTVTESNQGVTETATIDASQNESQATVIESVNNTEIIVAQNDNQFVAAEPVQEEVVTVDSKTLDSNASYMTQEEIEVSVREMVNNIPTLAESIARDGDTGRGGWYTPEFAAELEKQGYWEKLNQAIEEAKAAQANN